MVGEGKAEGYWDDRTFLHGRFGFFGSMSAAGRAAQRYDSGIGDPLKTQGAQEQLSEDVVSVLGIDNRTITEQEIAYRATCRSFFHFRVG